MLSCIIFTNETTATTCGESIAIIGWGSLIWAKRIASSERALRIRSGWNDDGPRLPLEFARVSKDGRLTLVILPTAPVQQTYWALSEFGFEGALNNLKLREGVSQESIHFMKRTGLIYGHEKVARPMKKWLAQHPEVSATIWTGLESNWNNKFSSGFSVEAAMSYLENKISAGGYSAIEEYIRRAPVQIQTELRAKAEKKFGWTSR